MLKTPIRQRRETEADQYFTYLANHVKRSPDTQRIATIDPSQSARTTWTTPQVTILCILLTLTVVALWSFGISVLTLLFTLVTILYVAMLCLSVAWMVAVARSGVQTPFPPSLLEELKDAPWPRYTILCPLYREKVVVRQFVQAMQQMDYPTDCLQVLFLTEEDDLETRNALLAMNLPSHFEVVTVPQGMPKTKPRACNWGLQMATGDYVVIFDAEDIPDPQQCKKAILTFASSDVNVACVQAKLNFYNPTQNLLTRWFTIEYSLWFDLILPGLQALGFSLPLGGTSNHFRMSALKALGGWDAYNVTEDCDLGLKLAKYQFRTVMLDSTTYEEANSRTLSWLRQRSRWIKGYMQTYLVHTRHPLKAIRQGKMKDIFSLHLFVGAGSFVLLINPIMWAMFAAYLIWRPVDLYHHLFPWPILYAGMFCFLVGNFLPIYVSMIACMKREQYALVKWCLLLPFYWVLASIASFLAGYELLTNPHKWHKTEHGLHLQDKKSTAKVAAIQLAGKSTIAVKTVQPMGTVTQSVRAISTMPVPAITIKRRGKKITSRDPWLLATILLACVCSITATTYFFIHHDILLYGDAYSHLRIARDVFDNATPGLAQLGGVWLPLPHILMWPFIWNDYLWQTGLAGSFVSMICYIVSASYLYLLALRLTKNSVASILGALVFISNPNVLYLQSTPLSELVCICFFFISCYYFFMWLQDICLSSLIICATSTFLASITRYDGWMLCAILFISITFVLFVRRKVWSLWEGHIILFGSLAASGIILWLIWNKIIFGDPTFFSDGPFSAKAQQLFFLKQGLLFGYHNIIQSIRIYALDAAQNIGGIVSVLALVAWAIFAIEQRKRASIIIILVALVPFIFYVYALYQGNAVIFTPWATPASAPYHLFNVRYGVQMIGFIAIGISLLAEKALIFMKKNAIFFILPALSIMIIGQAYFVVWNGAITFQDGFRGFACQPQHLVNLYLAEHYDGGKILNDVSSSLVNESQSGIDFKNIVYDGSGSLWHQALNKPASVVNWVAVTPDSPNDLVARSLNVSTSKFLSNFTLVYRESNDNLQLYHRKGLPPLPNRSIYASFEIDNRACHVVGA